MAREIEQPWDPEFSGPFSAEELAVLLAEDEEPWNRNRRMVKRGYLDLAYLPKSKTGWNATLASLSFYERLRHCGGADLNLWATMHGCPGSARYADLGEDALVLWHGTSAARAHKIRRLRIRR